MDKGVSTDVAAASATVVEELTKVGPVLAAHLKIKDRVTLVERMKQGLSAYTPS